MKVFIKESLYVLDYKNDIVDLIFASDDKRTPGYAYNINIEESNTGYSNLSFTMPTRIFAMPNSIEEAHNEEELIPNPKLDLLTPLVKLRYHRQVVYTGDETVVVQEPVGYGDTTDYIEKEYNPNDVIEDYKMDYIVQPLSKKRSGYEVSITFNAIDYPRFNLSKKKFGLTINDETITRDDWSIYASEPMSIPGTVQYVQWTDTKSEEYGQDIPTEWNPSAATDYPLTISQIESLLSEEKLWTYGITATVYWWPITSTARYDGVLYNKGDYLTLQIYPKFETGTADTSLIETNLDFYGYEWLYLDKGASYLTPNNPCNYLNWALETTNWSIKSTADRFKGIFYTDTFVVDGAKTGDYVLIKTINVDNKYIGVIDKEENLPNDYNTNDFGKWCNIGPYVHSWDGYKWYVNYNDRDKITTAIKMFNGTNWVDVTKEYWTDSIDKKTGVLYDVDQVETEVAKPDQAAGDLFETTELRTALSLSDSNCYNAITEISKSFQLYPVFDCEARTVALKLFSGKNYGLTYMLGRSLENTLIKEDGDKVITKLYSFGGQDLNGQEDINLGDAERAFKEPADNPDERENWDPNFPEYIQKRSPYGTNYIYNFKWMYDNGWMSKEQILGIYNLNNQIQDLNKKFLPAYTTDYLKTNDEYVNAGVIYSTNQDEFLACLNAMMNTYYRTPGDTTEKFMAFPEKPADCYEENGRCYLDVYHCYKCGATLGHTFTGDKCTTVGCDGIPEERTIHINTWLEESRTAGTTSEQWNPSSKGFYQQVYEQLDDTLRSHIKIGKKFIEKPIDTQTNEKKFEINGVDVYDKSGKLYNWNDYVSKWVEFYGYSLDNEIEVNELQHKVEMLDESFKVYQAELQTLEDTVQDTYGDYIIEGKFKDEEIVYPAILLAKTLEASEQYAVPEITYSLSVVDSSGLIEYRAPQLDVYNELVRCLHSLGQIVPKPGDYISIYDEPMGLYGVPGLITTIKRVIDNPQTNSITVDTSYTDNEELVGNIITATNTVLGNKDIYARTAVLKADGTIESAALSKSLEEASNGTNLAFVGAKGSVLLDSSGLLVTNPSNQDRKMKYSGSGIFGSVDNGSTYEPMITPEGINANYVSAGSIDTQKVQIMSGMYGAVVLDNYGLSVKDNISKDYKLPTTTKTIEGVNFLDWGNSNLKAFVGVNGENEGQIYLKGQMQIDGGSTIAGWNVLPNKLSSGSGSSYVALSSDGSYAFWAGNATASQAPVYIKADGSARFTNVEISGSSTVSGTNIDAKSITASQLADGTITTGKLQDRAITGVKIGQNVIAAEHIVANSITAGQIAAGAITAEKIAAGAVSASKVAADVITTSNFSAQSINADKITAGTITAAAINLGSGKFKVTTAGAVTSTSGTIGGFTLGGVSFSGATAKGTMKIQRGDSACVDFPANGGRLMIGSSASNGVALTTASSLVISDSYSHTDTGDSNASIGIRAINGNIRIASNSGVRINGSGGNLLTVSDRVYMCNLNLNGTTFTSTNGAQMWCNQNCAFKPASGYSAVVQDTGGSNHKIKTNGGDLSSRNIKTNFEILTPYNEQLLEEFDKVNTYHYDYLYKESSFAKEDDYGFVIDELEEQPLLSKIFLHKEENLQIKNGDTLVSLEEPDDSLPNITVKRWDSESYIRGLFILTKALHNKVKELEEQLKKEKTN